MVPAKKINIITWSKFQFHHTKLVYRFRKLQIASLSPPKHDRVGKYAFQAGQLTSPIDSAFIDSKIIMKEFFSFIWILWSETGERSAKWWDKPVNGKIWSGFVMAHYYVQLPSSRRMAMRRLQCFVKNFILFKFREKKVGISGDQKEIFHVCDRLRHFCGAIVS